MKKISRSTASPVASSVDELDAAMHPATPVTQAVAEQSAATIVRLSYPAFSGITPVVAKQSDFGVEHWVVEYTDATGPTPKGLRISITVDKGRVEVTTFP